MKNIFQQIIDREVDTPILYEDDICIIIKDINPQAPVHFLCIPKRPVGNVATMKADDAPILGHLLFRIHEFAKKNAPNNEYRLVINNGESAGQTVPHLHVHLLAGRPFGWPPG